MNIESIFLQITLLGLLIIAALFGGKISRKFHVGEVVGQILAGLIVGPILFYLTRQYMPHYLETYHSFLFFIFIFLGIIAFGVGEELSLENLRHMGRDAMIICFIQAFVTWVVITVTFFLLGFKPIVALIIGSIGIATASGTTFIIMNKLDITGKIRSVLGGIVVLDDVIEVIVFSIFCQIALFLQKGGEGVSASALVMPLFREFGAALLIGFGIFLAIRLTIRRGWLESAGKDNELTIRGPELLSRLVTEMPGPSTEAFIVIAGFISMGIGLAIHMDLPFLLTAVIAGVLISNFYSPQVFQSLRIENATAIFTLMFFALVGANARLEAFRLEYLLYILCYVAARAAGKYFGNWIGCTLTHQDKRITASLPKLMLPQTGVAAVEAYYVAAVLGADGHLILSIILPALIIFDIIGIILSEKTLLAWRSWITGSGELLTEEEEVRKLIEKEKMRLADIIEEDTIVVPFEADSRGDAIWKLIRVLQSNGAIRRPGQALDYILQREHQGGTTIGEGITIFHGRLPDLVQPALALAILPENKSIQIDPSDNRGVDIFFMLLTPPSKPAVHLQIMAAIARFLSNKEAREKIRGAKNPRQAMRIIWEYS